MVETSREYRRYLRQLEFLAAIYGMSRTEIEADLRQISDMAQLHRV